MKKIDKLILSTFLGPFILTFLVVVFILLTQHMLKYFDDIIGKDLGWDVVGSLLFYFAIFMSPVALPLGVLLSSLITFGNLGEHHEITAIKSLGISLSRSLSPIFGFVLALTLIAFYINNNLVPKAALEAYSLLYDIKQKKPALDLKEGAFISSIPDISIKVNKKFPDGKTLKGVIIYDHRGKSGNKEVTIADSGKMSTILNEQYLKLELFDGYNYNEGSSAEKDMSGADPTKETLSKTRFTKTQIVFDLSSFGMMRTDKKWFEGNRIMRNVSELRLDMDSVKQQIYEQQLGVYTVQQNLFRFHQKKDTITLPPALQKIKNRRDSIAKNQSKVTAPQQSTVVSVKSGIIKEDTLLWRKIKLVSDSIFNAAPIAHEYTNALNQVRMIKSQLINFNSQIALQDQEYRVFEIQWHKIFSNSFACIAMFLIGAPLGAIIKKGGLGVPVLVSIFFFIVFYLLSMIGDKWARADIIPVPIGVWAGDVILLLIGLILLKQAKADARLFDADSYNVMWDKAKTWLFKRNHIKPKTR
ncbi:MAG: LptF/LptG family permease [Bacteroidota bacterium]